MMVRKEIDVKQKPTPEQIAMLERAAVMPITYDEDCPELSDEELAQFKQISEFRKEERRKQTVSIRLSPQALDKARSLGKGYTAVLSRMLEVALNDKDLIQRCL